MTKVNFNIQIMLSKTQSLLISGTWPFASHFLTLDRVRNFMNEMQKTLVFPKSCGNLGINLQAADVFR